ncbi:hypothetical protein AMET1_0845 [Methanonatronarchaeum thermophilum]|uniref:Uncharacterized protein n=1 Tax=Methanonatronarchaeum thermophilum TaxID=1927129 RepID=A0A1Y3GCK9_9EURY|nr:hypothetical protein [Methanonatronarchaeum thermophilum]OUJ19192.1 hypothetical protein AMET1_0845 [Methanonatronarchaeum thermophilum]
MDKKIVLISLLIVGVVLATAGCIGGYDKSVSAEEGLAMLTDEEIEPEIQNHIDLEEVGLDVSDGNLLIAIETYGDIPSTIDPGASQYEVNIQNLDDEEIADFSLTLELIGDAVYFESMATVEGEVYELDGVEYTVDSKFFDGSEIIMEVPLDELGDPDKVGVQVSSEWSETDEPGTAMDFVPLDEDGNVDIDNYIEYEI